MTFPLFHKKSSDLILKMKKFSSVLKFELKKKSGMFFQYLKIFLGILLHPEAEENAQMFKFLFYGLDPKLVTMRIIALEHLRKTKKVFTKNSSSFTIQAPSYKMLVQNTKTQWKGYHDYLLSKGILKHGYGKWMEIIQDPTLWLRKNVPE